MKILHETVKVKSNFFFMIDFLKQHIHEKRLSTSDITVNINSLRIWLRKKLKNTFFPINFLKRNIQTLS